MVLAQVEQQRRQGQLELLLVVVAQSVAVVKTWRQQAPLRLINSSSQLAEARHRR